MCEPVSPFVSMLKVSKQQPGATEKQSKSGPPQDKGDDLGDAVEAKPLPEVYQPTAEEISRHCLTHLPYKRLCKWCAAARMRN